MPGTTGRALADLLHARYPALRVLYMSGYSSSLFADQDDAGTRLKVLEKPFSVKALLASVRDALA